MYFIYASGLTYELGMLFFSSLLLHRENCTFTNGEHVKAGLAELELWCSDVTEEVSLFSLVYNFPRHNYVLDLAHRVK